MRESDLAAKIVGWLNEQHYEVYQEVQGMGDRDQDKPEPVGNAAGAQMEAIRSLGFCGYSL